jgi:hypothetical protein
VAQMGSIATGVQFAFLGIRSFMLETGSCRTKTGRQRSSRDPNACCTPVAVTIR